MFLLASMMCITGLLFFEYRFFEQQLDHLLELKEDYQEYVTLLKQQLDELETTKNSMEFQKKKSGHLNIPGFPDDVTVFSSDSMCQDEQFTVINRDEKYLYDLVCEYVTKNGLKDPFFKLYDELSQTSTGLIPYKERSRIVTRMQRYKNRKKGEILDFSIALPLDRSNFWISSFFGPRKKADGSWGFHFGLDMAAIKGTPVYAAAGGKVIEVSNTPKGFGKSIVIMHNKKYKTRYAHLDAMFVRLGQRVACRQLIGRVGNTGLVRGKNASHLHLEVLVFGKRIDPLNVMHDL